MVHLLSPLKPPVVVCHISHILTSKVLYRCSIDIRSQVMEHFLSESFLRPCAWSFGLKILFYPYAFNSAKCWLTKHVKEQQMKDSLYEVKQCDVFVLNKFLFYSLLVLQTVFVCSHHVRQKCILILIVLIHVTTVIGYKLKPCRLQHNSTFQPYSDKFMVRDTTCTV